MFNVFYVGISFNVISIFHYHPCIFTFLVYMYNVQSGVYMKCKISDLKNKPGPPVQEKKKQRITPDILAKQGENISYLITRKEKTSYMTCITKL